MGINGHTRPNCDIPTPFYSHLLRVLREFAVNLSHPKSSKVYYDERVRNSVPSHASPLRGVLESIIWSWPSVEECVERDVQQLE